MFSPLHGNVIFASSRYNICFSLETFSEIYAAKYPKLNASDFSRRLWGDYFYNPETRKFGKKSGSDVLRTFVYFIMEPLYKIFAHVSDHSSADHF